VGYPNVGKSSTINVLAGNKRVAVSATPGKTKHFQTIELGDGLLMCDCPGLVFPSFMSTKNEMVCNGLIRIADLKDIYGPIRYVCNKIPRAILEHKYGIVLPSPREGEDPKRSPTPEELLDRYGYVRGFMTKSGLPDHQRSGKKILTAYFDGNLLYCNPPPGISEAEFNVLSERLATANALPTQTDHFAQEEEDEVEEVVVPQDGEETKEIEEEGEDFDLGDFALTPGTDPTPATVEDEYDIRAKPKGRKAQRRAKQKLATETDVPAFTSEQARTKKGRAATKQLSKTPKGRGTTLPRGVKLTATPTTVFIKPTSSK